MIEYQYFKVINTCNATPTGARQHGWRLQISFPAPNLSISKSLIQCIPFKRPQGARDHAVAGSHLVSRSKFKYQCFKVVNTSEATPRGTRPRGGRFASRFPLQ